MNPRSPIPAVAPFVIEIAGPWLAVVPGAARWPAAGRWPATLGAASWPDQGSRNPPRTGLSSGRNRTGHTRLDAFSCAHYRSAGLRSRRWSSRLQCAQARSSKRFERQGFSMSRRCELTGKSEQVGHKVSHSNIKTKRRFLPNLLNVTMISDALGRSVKLRVSANALKTVDHRGGLDAFLLKAKDDDLSAKALELKRQIRKKRAAAG